jgi:hypothetical protein
MLRCPPAPILKLALATTLVLGTAIRRSKNRSP